MVANPIEGCLKAVADIRESRLALGADGGRAGNDRDRDERDNEAVLDGCRTTLIIAWFNAELAPKF